MGGGEGVFHSRDGRPGGNSFVGNLFFSIQIARGKVREEGRYCGALGGPMFAWAKSASHVDENLLSLAGMHWAAEFSIGSQLAVGRKQ